jgi:hypothetical protein
VTGPSTLIWAAVALAAVAPVTDDAARAEVERIASQLAAVRRLPFRAALPVRTASREAMRADAAAALSAGIASSNIAVEEQILKRLGLIPATADYTKLLADATFSSPVPHYDPGGKRLLVPASEPLDGQRFLIAHEIGHALTDRRFGLDRFVKLDRDGRPLEGDAQRARQAVVEGDATVAALELHDRRNTLQGPHGVATLAERLGTALPSRGAPPWLVELARFTHIDGFSFVAGIRAQRPWSAVDAVWLDPPASSEQILHAEKYDACDEPVRIDEGVLPAALPGFDRRDRGTVLGELTIRAWLSQSLPAETAARAAAGWGGDRAVIYQPSPAEAAPVARADAGAPATIELPPVAWLTVWDDTAEADDFARAADQVAGPAIARRGEAVALFFGPRALAPAALDGTLDAWRASVTPPATKTTKMGGGRVGAPTLPLPNPPAMSSARQSRATLDAPKGGRPRPVAQPGCPRRDRTAAPP